jgi:hypothetical protein
VSRFIGSVPRFGLVDRMNAVTANIGEGPRSGRPAERSNTARRADVKNLGKAPGSYTNPQKRGIAVSVSPTGSWAGEVLIGIAHG